MREVLGTAVLVGATGFLLTLACLAVKQSIVDYRGVKRRYEPFDREVECSDFDREVLESAGIDPRSISSRRPV